MVIKSAILLFVLSLVNKGLGFIKSMTIASVFGATIQTDAYYVAEGLMLNMLIPISEAVAVSFLPVYIGIKEKDNQDSKVFTSRTIKDIFLLAFVLSVVLYITAPWVLKVILPSYTAVEVEMAVSYFRILIWGMCFYMSNHLLQSLLNAEKQYGFSSFTAMLNNLILTVAVLLLGYRFGMRAMAVAVPFSYIVQYVILQYKSKEYGHFTWKYGLWDSRIGAFCIQALPIFFGNAIYELNQLIDRSLLAGMDEGAVTAVSYATVLYQFASNLIGIPLTTIIYTELAESFAAGRLKEGGEKLEKGIKIGMLFCIPISFFVLLASELIVQVTYGRGAFDAQAVLMTAQGLRYYGLCFLPFCVHHLLNRAYYSLGDTLLPMKIGIGTVSANIALSILLARIMGLRGVVLATAIANTAGCLVSLWIFNKTKLTIHLRRFVKSFTKIILSSVLATIVCYAWMHIGRIENSIFLFITAACVELGIYALIMVLCKEEMIEEILLSIKSILKKRKKI